MAVDKFFYRDEDDDGNKYWVAGFSKEPAYREFYHKFVPKSSYRCVRQDFPRDCFVFANEEDEVEFLKQFADNISL